MQLVRATIALVALLGSASGCTTPPARWRSDLTQSTAWNVTHAAGLRALRDSEPMADAHGAALVGSALGASYTIASAVKPAPGFTSLTGGTLGALAWLARPTPEEPALTSRVLAWMPTQETASPDEARARMHDLLAQAFSDSLAEAELSFPVTRIEGASDRIEVTGLIQRRIPTRSLSLRIGLPDCDDRELTCRLLLLEPPPPEPAPAPDFAGSGEAWPFDILLGMITRRAGTWTTATRLEPRIDDLALYRDASRRLPHWAFIYLAPGKAAWRPEPERAPERLEPIPAPLVLHQGEVLAFRRPEPAP